VVRNGLGAVASLGDNGPSWGLRAISGVVATP